MNKHFNVIADADPDSPEVLAEAAADCVGYLARRAVALDTFLVWYQKMEEDRYGTSPSQLDAKIKVTMEYGTKNIRVVTARYGSRSSSCFVRKSDGAILKCAGWKAPFIAKGGPHAPMTVRGSIFDQTTWSANRWA